MKSMGEWGENSEFLANFTIPFRGAIFVAMEEKSVIGFYGVPE
jgi:hypothetical protein